MNRIINWRYEKWDNNEKNNDKKYSEDDISDYINDHISLLAAVVFAKLAEVLNPQTGAHFVASCRCN